MAIKIHKLGVSVCRLPSLPGIGFLSVTVDVIFEPKDESALLLLQQNPVTILTISHDFWFNSKG